MVSDELLFKVNIDVLLLDGADRRALGRQVLQTSLPMKAAVTFPSRSTSPCTLPRGAGCLRQGLWFRWLRARVWDPVRAFRD